MLNFSNTTKSCSKWTTANWNDFVVDSIGCSYLALGRNSMFGSRVGDHGCVNNHWRATFLDHASHALGPNATIVEFIAGIALKPANCGA